MSNAFRTKVRLKKKGCGISIMFPNWKFIQICWYKLFMTINSMKLDERYLIYITSCYLYMQIQFYNKSEPNIQYNRNIYMTKFTNQLLVKPDSTTLSLMKWCLLWVWGFWRPLTIYHENRECELFLRVSHLMLHIIILWVVAAFRKSPVS